MHGVREYTVLHIDLKKKSRLYNLLFTQVQIAPAKNYN